jgi:hypothetical protein
VTTRAVAMIFGWVIFAGCAHDPVKPDYTDDGLMRAPSSGGGAVYRVPGASFVQYRRILLKPLGIEFVRSWRRLHPEVKEADLLRIHSDLMSQFREEFVRELVTRGIYTLADEPGPDVIEVTPRIFDLDIRAPMGGQRPGERSLVEKTGEMSMIAEMRDSLSGVLLGRVLDEQRARKNPFGRMQVADSTSNAEEARLAFQHWSRLLREALDIAKVEKPANR